MQLMPCIFLKQLNNKPSVNVNTSKLHQIFVLASYNDKNKYYQRQALMTIHIARTHIHMKQMDFMCI